MEEKLSEIRKKPLMIENAPKKVIYKRKNATIY